MTLKSFIAAILFLGFSPACADPNGKHGSADADIFLNKCIVEYDMPYCVLLEGRFVSLSGQLLYTASEQNNSRSKLLMTNKAEHCEVMDQGECAMNWEGYHETNDQLIPEVYLEISEGHEKMRVNMNQLNGKNVKVSGEINTQCMIDRLKIRQEVNEHNSRVLDDDDKIILATVGRPCNATITDFNIEEVRQ